MQGSFLFLGSGASAGVPLIGCKCSVCASSNPKNKRLRPSGLIRINDKSYLIDATPDLRTQALKFGVDRVDGLILTHTHFDHIAGIDDLRILNVWQKGAIPCLLSQPSLLDMKTRYAYLFDEQKATAKFDFIPLSEKPGKMDFLGTEFAYFHYTQNEMQVTGFRIGDFAYITDIKSYDEAIFPFLSGVKTLVISALKPEPSHFHLCFEEAIAFSIIAGAKQTWITHVTHGGDHDEFNAALPDGVQVAYDGLEVEFNCTK